MAEKDLISREALRKRFASECPGDCTTCDYSSATNGRLWCGLIDAAPAVDAAPVVHSKWVWIPDEEEANTWHLVCDACKHGGLFEDDNYCPNCGAKMDEEQIAR